MSYLNKNDFFYNTIYNQLANLKTNYNDIVFTDDIDETKTKSICIAISDDTKGEYNQNLNNIVNQRNINFQVYYFERVSRAKNQAKEIRDRQFKMHDIIETELLKINKLDYTNKTYTYLNLITNEKVFDVTIKNIEINDVLKTLPQNDNETYFLLFSCEFKYQQRLY